MKKMILFTCIFIGLMHLGIAQAFQSFEETGLKHAIDRDPNSPLLREQLGDLYYSNNQYAEALVQFDAVISLNPQDIYAHYFSGLCHEKMQAYEKALDAYHEALRLSMYKIRYRQAKCAYELHDYKSALTYLKEIETTEAIPDIHYMVALTYENLNQFKESLDELEQAKNLDQNFLAGKNYFSDQRAYDATREDLEMKLCKIKMIRFLQCGGIFLISLLIFFRRFVFRSIQKIRSQGGVLHETFYERFYIS